MDLDDLIRHADPARDPRHSPVTVKDARRPMDAATITGRSPLGPLRVSRSRRIGWSPRARVSRA